MKGRVGVDKEDTLYAPQLVTWLNQERWKDGTGAVAMKPEEVEAARKRSEEKAREFKERMNKLSEDRFNQLMGKSA